jgi:hypothetical protein
MMDDKDQRMPILEPGHTFASVTDKISSIVLTTRTPRYWWIGFAISFLLTMLLLVSVTYLFAVGTGIWGINIPIGWGFAIINFIWWIGIGHAGTLISAILLLMRQNWRTSINRFAEAMTFSQSPMPVCFHSCTWGGPGSSTISFPIPIRWSCGLNFAARWCGTFSRSPLMVWSALCSGMWV